jgi:hypothetical protein
VQRHSTDKCSSTARRYSPRFLFLSGGAGAATAEAEAALPVTPLCGCTGAAGEAATAATAAPDEALLIYPGVHRGRSTL